MSDKEKKRRALLPYGTDFSAPRIELPDVDLFKTQRGSKAHAYFRDSIYRLQQQYEDLIALSKLNETCYGAEYNFEPVVGQTYHLYRLFSGKMILSLIEPPWSSMEYMDSVEFTADSIWKSIDFTKKT